jgi:hypothetical protein
MSRTLVIAMIICLAFQGPALAQSAPAQARPPSAMQKISNFIENFYKDLFYTEKEPDPSGTLIAPFADKSHLKPLTEQQKIAGVLPTNQSPLDRSHRSVEDLSKWLLMAIPQCLSFTADSYPEQLETLATGFSDPALEQFKAWVNDTGIMSSLQNNGMQLNGFVTEQPFLLNEGVVNGRYRWLFEVPVMVSFVPRGTTSYSQEKGIRTQRLMITLQLGRIPNSIIEHGIDIESWSVQDNRRKN